MDSVRLFYTLVIAFSIPAALLLIAYAHKRRNVPGASCFIGIMVFALLYNAAYIGEINSDTVSIALFWFDLEHIPNAFIHYFWLLTSLKYVRMREKQFRLFKYVMLYHPVAYLIIYFTNPLHHLYIRSIRFESNGHFPVIVSDKGPLFLILVLSGTMIGLISVVYYVYGYVKAPRLQRGGYLIMVVASLFPWSAVYISAVGLGPFGVDYFPVFCAFSGVLYAFGMFRYRIFNTIPIATETVFRQSREAIMLIDSQDQIIDVNSRFLELYPELDRLSRKQAFVSFLQAHAELEGLGGGRTRLQYRFLDDGGPRYFSAELTAITAEDERLLIGKILTIEDVTLFVEHEKRLEAIAQNAIAQAESSELSFLQAQIKPHFLNNTLSVIASMITRSPAEAKALIAELGEHLANCYYFDDSSPMVSLEKELESVNTYVFIEKARFRERLNFHLVCDRIPQMAIPRLILQPLVENAIRHGIFQKAGEGNVWLIIGEDGGSIRFEVGDDGVGISEHAVQNLLCDSGGSRSIGLSNINKRLHKYYGTQLQITSRPGQGTTVVFAIPRRT